MQNHQMKEISYPALPKSITVFDNQKNHPKSGYTPCITHDGFYFHFYAHVNVSEVMAIDVTRVFIRCSFSNPDSVTSRIQSPDSSVYDQQDALLQKLF